MKLNLGFTVFSQTCSSSNLPRLSEWQLHPFSGLPQKLGVTVHFFFSHTQYL